MKLFSEFRKTRYMPCFVIPVGICLLTLKCAILAESTNRFFIIGDKIDNVAGLRVMINCNPLVYIHFQLFDSL